MTYHAMHDLPCGDATRLLLPRIQNALAASEFSCAEKGELQRTCDKEGGTNEEEELHVWRYIQP